MREGGRRGRDRGAREAEHHEAVLGARALEEPGRRAPRDRHAPRYAAPGAGPEWSSCCSLFRLHPPPICLLVTTPHFSATVHPASLLGATTSPLQAREKLYLLAVGHYRNGDYPRSRQFVDQCLEVVRFIHNISSCCRRGSARHTHTHTEF